MKNLNLKSFIIAIVLISALIIAGSLIVNLIRSNKIPKISQPNQAVSPIPTSTKPATGGESSPTSLPNLPDLQKPPIPKVQTIK